jgi:hypothetical protein
MFGALSDVPQFLFRLSLQVLFNPSGQLCHSGIILSFKTKVRSMKRLLFVIICAQRDGPYSGGRPLTMHGSISRHATNALSNSRTSKKGEIVFTDQRLHRVIKVASGQVSTLAGNNIIDPC